LDRKIELAKRNVQYRNRLRLKIKTVEFVGKKEAQCITVNNNDALYVARNYIVTHNTRTAETLSELLHGTDKNVLRIDCGEYQMEHEVAKLIGAPPGYLGHRETHPILSQAKINSVATDKCDFSIVLFDEIEKASSAMWRLLLGILDKATLRLGDNTTADFQKTLIFMSSNLGAKEMSEIFTGGFGFGRTEGSINVNDFNDAHMATIEKIGLGAMSRRFPPEFPNRVDEIITYRPLNSDSLSKITILELNKIQSHIVERLGNKGFSITYDDPTIAFFTKNGTSIQYGARELKRIINRQLMNPLSDEYIAGKILPSADVNCRLTADGENVMWDIDNPGPFEYSVEEPYIQEDEPVTTTKQRRRKSTA
jgi:ATP-dependent Clp protease ATP-binding subunit ClpA